MADSEPLQLPIPHSPAAAAVAGLLDAPPQPQAVLVLAHGAGAGMRHPFMSCLAGALAARGVAVLRLQFPSMTEGRGRPDPPDVAQAAIEAGLAAAADRFPELPLYAGGKSFGGRMATALQAVRPWRGLGGVVLFGFPLHPPGKPGTSRADHLPRLNCPMLFLQGTRDTLARMDLVHEVLGGLPGARLHVVEGADHAFHVGVRSGRTDQDVLQELAAVASDWMLQQRTARA